MQLHGSHGQQAGLAQRKRSCRGIAREHPFLESVRGRPPSAPSLPRGSEASRKRAAWAVDIRALSVLGLRAGSPPHTGLRMVARTTVTRGIALSLEISLRPTWISINSPFTKLSSSYLI